MVKKSKQGGSSSDFSRRDFLRGGTVGAISTGLLSGGVSAEPLAAQDVEILGPGAVAIALRINGRVHRLTLEPRVTLLDALRNHLDLTGSKRVCDRGTCGACTVLLDGQAVYACSVLAIDAQDREIRTIESLGSSDDLHPLQAAFIENDAQQCGFCTPGFVVACTAFLKENPRPTAEDIRHGLGGNLCRCGTYAGIRNALNDLGNTQTGGGRDA